MLIAAMTPCPCGYLGEQVQRYRSRVSGPLLDRIDIQVEVRDLQSDCPVEPAAHRLLAQAMEKLARSARAYTRILKVARTIADLAGSAPITTAHVAEAIQYRRLDRALH